MTALDMSGQSIDFWKATQTGAALSRINPRYISKNDFLERMNKKMKKTRFTFLHLTNNAGDRKKSIRPERIDGCYDQ